MSLGSLPQELIAEIGTFCNSQQLASLALVNRCFYNIFSPLLYRHNALYDEPSQSCVLWAAKNGSLKTLKLALAEGANINTIGAEIDGSVWHMANHDPRSWNSYAAPLHHAIVQQHEDIVKYLLENGAELEVPSEKLCGCDSPELYGSPVTIWYPFHHAICDSNASILSLLLKHGAFRSAEDLPGIACAMKVSLSTVEAILQHDSVYPHYRDATGCTALHMVVNCDDHDLGAQIVHKLVDHGVPVNVQSTGSTAVNLLIGQLLFKPAIALLERGADASVDRGRGLGIIDRLFHEQYQWYIEQAQIERPSEANEMKQDRRRLLELVIARGADVNRLLGQGNPPLSRPLYWALIVSRDVECVRMMLDAGARIEDAFVDTESRSEGLLRGFFNVGTGYIGYGSMGAPDEVIISLFEKYEGSVKLLLEKGARIDAPDGERSALYHTCERLASPKGSWELEFLVEHATSRNVSAEYVEASMRSWTTHKRVYALLNQLHEKLIEENDGESTGIRGEEKGEQ
ncbi:hypothetical protein FSARC_3836 [Fusarium sarcochroum]|uniref:F-box domain-containing protein n=1 Tax=Fusarium sarcochroum TaxID=1208366 RepID=A0A8H4XBA3_9HYPO|nr:hypothetical protein FSARC_3836 [Fusarium sarcochroum]